MWTELNILKFWTNLNLRNSKKKIDNLFETDRWSLKILQNCKKKYSQQFYDEINAI